MGNKGLDNWTIGGFVVDGFSRFIYVHSGAVFNLKLLSAEKVEDHFNLFGQKSRRGKTSVSGMAFSHA
jgi:hypothetical protein